VSFRVPTALLGASFSALGSDGDPARPQRLGVAFQACGHGVCRRAMLTAWRALRRRSTRGTATPTSRTRSSGTAAPIFSSCPPRRSRSTCCGTSPRWRGHLHRLASFSRLILTDLLGSGSSDAVPIHDRPAMQTWTDGLVAVLDAVGSKCASVFAWSESGLPVMLLTASHPHRVRSLVLCSPFARFLRASDQPFGMPESALVNTSTASSTRSGPVRWSTCWRPAGRATPPSGALVGAR